MAVNVNGGALEFSAVINAQQFNAAISSIERQLAGLTKTAETQSSAIDNLVRKTTSAIAGYATFITSTNFVSDIVRVRGEFQQLEIAFGTMLGSKEKADRLLAEVTQFAATTPFELQDVAKATKQLLAFGIESDKVIGTLRSLGDVSAGIGAPLGDIAYLFGTIKTQGVALTQDIRQFASRGIPIYEELAKVLGVNTEQVGEFITAGKVGFPEVEQVFKNLTAEGSKFGGLMEAQSKSLTGQLSNLRDAWNQMLNDIGKGQEGLFSDIISGATYLVKNFDDVIKILKILVITYGSYKAAVIATNVVTAISTTLTKGYTIAETLRYQAMLLSERAMKLLNATMLKNPVVLVATGLAALVASLTLFSKRTTEAQRSQKLLNEVQMEASKIVVEETNKLNALLKVAQDESKSKEVRLEAVKKLNQISPEYLGNLTLENLKTAEGKKLIDEYIKSLQNKARAQALSNKLVELETKKLEIENAIQNSQNDRSTIGKAALKSLEAQLLETDGNIKNFAKQQFDLTVQQLEGDKKKQVSAGRTVSVIEEEIKATKELQSANAVNSEQYQQFQKKINALEAEKKAITGDTKKEIAATNKLEGQTNSLLEKRKDLLEQIADMKRQSDRTGLVKEQTELDKINERYDGLIQNIDEYNKKVEAYNKKNPKSQVQKVGQADIQVLNNARTQELTNTDLKQQAELYKKHLQEQKELFDKFEEAKKEVGLQKARELFGDQTKQYETFLEMLQEEADRIAPYIKFGIANVGEVEKYKAIMAQITEFTKGKNEKEIEEEKQKFISLLQAAATYNDQRAAINKKYDDLEAELSKNASIGEVEERKKLLEQSRQDELNGLNSVIARSSELYRKLNQDILLYTRERLKEEIKLLKAKLKADTGLTPQQKADIQGTINQYQGLLNETNKVAAEFGKISDALGQLSGAFFGLGDSLSGTNDGLSKMFNTLGDIANIGGQAAGAVASFASGDIVGGITKTIGALASLFSIGKRARERRKKEQDELNSFLIEQFKGEQEINRIYRERALEQVKLNKLRIQGLVDEANLLKVQKQQVQSNYAATYAEIQKLTAKVRKASGRGFTEESLFGRSYEDLQKLFLSGQLEGKAADLFQLLEQLKTEGLDIDKALEENKIQLQELFTGTTSDSISDSIIQGFQDGKRGAADFAGTFEDLMRQAIIQSLKFKYLEGPIKDFFTEFAAASESDGQLTSAEINQLRDTFNGIINNANSQFEQLKQIAGLNFGGTGGTVNSLTGAIKGITEQQAELLAGQFGGLRITALDTLAVSRQQLSVLQSIQVNTGTTVARLQTIIDKMIYYYETRGVKMY